MLFMKKSHIFVPLLDVQEILPFALGKEEILNEGVGEEDRAKKELLKFIEKLEKNFGEDIYYIGMDIIGEKSYERFILKKGGFLEVMIEKPLALNAHFINKRRAKKFLDSLKKSLKTISKNKNINFLLDSLQVQTEEDTSLSVERWNIMKSIRDVYERKKS